METRPIYPRAAIAAEIFSPIETILEDIDSLAILEPMNIETLQFQLRIAAEDIASRLETIKSRLWPEIPIPADILEPISVTANKLRILANIPRLELDELRPVVAELAIRLNSEILTARADIIEVL